MRYRPLKLGLVAVTALAAALPLVAIQPAYADYNPNPGDVVGVGSDTLQYMVDFMADGDAYGDTGYNTTLHNKYKLVNIDATADANARLAYGVDGGQPGQTTCTPGTGSTAGTGNATGTNTGIPCVLNPTVVLRSGQQAVQRPNGSGGGFKALIQDMVAGHNTSATEVINFSRASATQTIPTGTTFPTGVILDQLSVASDTLPLLTATTTHAVPLSPSQLSVIYAQNTCSLTWSNPLISGFFLKGATVTGGSTTVTFPSTDPQPTSAVVGDTVETETASGGITTDIPSGDTVASVGTNSITLTTAATTGGTDNVGIVTNTAAGASDAIVPLVPQVGSGTRSFFLGQLVPALSGPGTCPQVSEENDPTAVYDVAGTNSADAIEPMSTGREDVYKGVSNTGADEGIGGYFLDPSCAYLSGSASCGTGTVGGTPAFKTNSVNPAVSLVSTGTPAGLGAYTGTGQGGGLFDPTRTLYMYFRNSDITSTTGWQPGSPVNWLNTLFYDPCETGQTCTGPGGIYGPAGAPYIQGPGAVLLEDAGVNPIATQVCTEISNGNAAC